MRIKALKWQAEAVYNVIGTVDEFFTITIYSYLPTRPYVGGTDLGNGFYLGGQPSTSVPYVVGYLKVVPYEGPVVTYYLNHGTANEALTFVTRELTIGELVPTRLVVGILSMDGKIEVSTTAPEEAVPLTEDLPWYTHYYPSIIITGPLSLHYYYYGGSVRGAVFSGFDENPYVYTSER